MVYRLYIRVDVEPDPETTFGEKKSDPTIKKQTGSDRQEKNQVQPLKNNPDPDPNNLLVKHSII